jgi:nicotinamidase-related amidase
MAVTTLDPKTALIVIDLQNGILGFPAAHPVEQIVRHASTLADAFRAHGLPVVLSPSPVPPAGCTERPRGGTEQQPPAGWADLAPDLNQQPDDHTVTKRTWGAFHDTGLDQHLQSLVSRRS